MATCSANSSNYSLNLAAKIHFHCILDACQAQQHNIITTLTIQQRTCSSNASRDYTEWLTKSLHISYKVFIILSHITIRRGYLRNGERLYNRDQ